MAEGGSGGWDCRVHKAESGARPGGTVIIPALGKTKEGRFSFHAVGFAVSSR